MSRFKLRLCNYNHGPQNHLTMLLTALNHADKVFLLLKIMFKILHDFRILKYEMSLKVFLLTHCKKAHHAISLL